MFPWPRKSCSQELRDVLLTSNQDGPLTASRTFEKLSTHIHRVSSMHQAPNCILLLKIVVEYIGMTGGRLSG